MEDNFKDSGPCVCGFGDEFFSLEGDRPVCTVCGGIIEKQLPEFYDEEKSREKKTILIIDDQAFFRERISSILQENGHEVVSAGDGLEAIRHVADVYVDKKPQLLSRFDVIFLDLVMPGDLDGFQTLAVLKTLIPAVPVFILTSRPPKRDLLEKLAKLGAKKYLNKSAAELDKLVLNNIQNL